MKKSPMRTQTLGSILGVGNVWNPWLDVRKSSYHTEP